MKLHVLAGIVAQFVALSALLFAVAEGCPKWYCVAKYKNGKASILVRTKNLGHAKMWASGAGPIKALINMKGDQALDPDDSRREYGSAFSNWNTWTERNRMKSGCAGVTPLCKSSTPWFCVVTPSKVVKATTSVGFARGMLGMTSGPKAVIIYEGRVFKSAPNPFHGKGASFNAHQLNVMKGLCHRNGPPQTN